MACEYCEQHSTKEIFPGSYDGDVGFITLLLESAFGVLTLRKDGFTSHYAINNCPMCGEKLGGDA